MRAIAGAAAALLVLGIVGVFVVNEEADTVATTGDSTTTTLFGAGPPPTEAPPGAPAPGAPGAPAPGQPGPGGPAPTAAPGPAAATPPPASGQPGPLTPPKAGLYRYKVSEDGEEKRSELRITNEGGSASDPQFRYRESVDGTSTESVVSWRGNGVFEASRTFPDGGGGSSECDWNPDILVSPRPLKADSAWSWDGSCTTTAGGQQADVRFTGNAKVVGTARAAVGGKQVDVWRTELTGRIEITGVAQGQPYRVLIDLTSQDQVAPDRGLIVRSEATTKITDPAGRTRESKSTEELQNVDPA
jgi:hypothetical protein